MFDDPWTISVPDELHSDQEERHIIVGRAVTGPLLTVVDTMRGDAPRIISARRATRREGNTMSKVHETAQTIGHTVDGAGVAPDLPDEVDFSGGVRGRHWPKDPAVALPKVLERLKAVQENAGALYDENERLRVLLAREAGMLSDGQAAKLLDVDHGTLRELREAALQPFASGAGLKGQACPDLCPSAFANVASASSYRATDLP